MMKRMRVSTEGLSRMRGAIATPQRPRQKQAVQHHQSTSEFSSQVTSASTSTITVKPRAQRNPEQMPQDIPPKDIRCDIQSLANIILHQARRIEKQKRELECLKRQYERHVSTIKSNAVSLEQHLDKLRGNLNQTRARQLDKHYQEIFVAVEKLQKCGLDLSQTQTITNHLLVKLLNSRTSLKN